MWSYDCNSASMHQPSIQAATMFTALVWIFVVLIAGLGLSEPAGIIVSEIVELVKRLKA
jgi:hypothetical protein